MRDPTLHLMPERTAARPAARTAAAIAGLAASTLLLVVSGCGSKPPVPVAQPVAAASETDDDFPFGSKHRDEAIAVAAKAASRAMPSELDLAHPSASYAPMPTALLPRRETTSGPPPRCWI